MSSYMLFSIVVLALTLRQTAGFQINDCAAEKNPAAKLKAITVSSCPDAHGDRCDLIKGTNVTLNVEFEPTRVFSAAQVAIAGKLGSLYIPFNLPGPSNACGSYGFDCPVNVGQSYNLKLSLPILSFYPSLKLDIRFKLDDEAKKPIFCFQFPVELKKTS